MCWKTQNGGWFHYDGSKEVLVSPVFFVQYSSFFYSKRPLTFFIHASKFMYMELLLSVYNPWPEEFVTVHVYHVVWEVSNPYLCFPCDVG